MAENTKIEWADHTLNFWIGCSKVSPACDFCYAEAQMDTRHGRARWGAGEPRVRTAPSTWNAARKWNRQAEANRTRPFVFSLSLGDIWDKEVDPAWRHDAFDLMRDTPNLIYLLLSKRIGNAVDMALEAGGLPENAALGATFCDQKEYDRDARKLWGARMALNPLFTFGSFEPLLGAVILDEFAPSWIIVGGESGPRARDMDLDHARSLDRQCAERGLIFNFKQVGGRGKDKGGHLLDGRARLDRPKVMAHA